MAGGVDVSIVWNVSLYDLAERVKQYGEKLIKALHELGDYFAGVLEGYAKENAPWTDRTGHARQGLTGVAQKAAAGVVIILYHKAIYGIWLEVANAGTYGIILQTMEANHGAVMAACRALIGA